MLKVAVIIGNPQPNSRTGKIAEMVAKTLLVGQPVDIAVIELADYASELFSRDSKRAAGLAEQVASCDLVVFASPTYKACFTGLLKAFLDRYDNNGLRGVTAIAVMTGGNAAHELAPTVTLVPLLMELGAIVPVKGLFFVVGEGADLEALVGSQGQELRLAFGRLAKLSSAFLPAAA
ncbi:putative flavoprotein [Rhizobium sp. CF142]|nr:putative flavoprotein [Rhizobium sp. CF142]